MSGNTRGVIVTYDIIRTVKELAGKLRYTVREKGLALALAEQLRLLRVGMAVSEPVFSAKENRPYSDDLGRCTEEQCRDRDRRATKVSKAHPYCPQEVEVLFALCDLAAFQ